MTRRSCRIFFSLLRKPPDIVQSFSVMRNDLVELAAILFRLPIFGGDVDGLSLEKKPIPPDVLDSYGRLFFSRGFMLVCVQNTLRRMPNMTMGAMKDCCSKPQVGQTVRWPSMKVSTSLFDERHTTSSSLWNGRVGLVFFRAWCWLPTDDMRVSRYASGFVWRSKQLFSCCSVAVGCEFCVELHCLSVNGLIQQSG